MKYPETLAVRLFSVGKIVPKIHTNQLLCKYQDLFCLAPDVENITAPCQQFK